MHMEIRNINMTWKPTPCIMIQEKILPPDQNTTKNKWELIQKHNHQNQTPQDKINRTNQYISQLNQKRNNKK